VSDELQIVRRIWREIRRLDNAKEKVRGKIERSLKRVMLTGRRLSILYSQCVFAEGEVALELSGGLEFCANNSKNASTLFHSVHGIHPLRQY
jgi:hypothetical protein